MSSSSSLEPHRIAVVIHVVAAVCTVAAAIAATIVPRGNEIVSSGHRRWGTVLVGDAVHGALRELPWGRRSRTACRARRLRSSRNSSSIVIHVVAIIASVVNGCSYRRLKPRQRHRIAVVIHVVPRSSSDLTARRPRASSIIIIITSLLGSLADTEPPSPLRQRRGEPPPPACSLQARRRWRMRCRLRCPSVPSSSGLMAPMALARFLWRRLIGTPNQRHGLQIGTGSRRTHACWAQLRPTCVTG